MSAEQPPADLSRLLRGLGQSSLSPMAPADEAAREQRMAARIDAQIADLAAKRRAARRTGFTFLAAAIVVLSLGSVRYWHRGGPQLTIEQEPLVAGKGQVVKPPLPEQPEEPAVTPPRVAAPIPRAGSVTPTEVGPAPSSAPIEPGSTLAQENQLFKDAAEASRSGDTAGALSRLDRLLAEHPSSPLAQAALVRKFRLLAAAGRIDEARHEAERYLTSYPTGFAVSEAEAVQNSAPAAASAKSPEPATP
jgi:hypothetical protein